MQKLIIIAASAAALLGLTGFVAQQTIGYDSAAGSVCLYDRAASPTCVAIGSIDPVTHRWSPFSNGTITAAPAGPLDKGLSVTNSPSGTSASNVVLNSVQTTSDTADVGSNFVLLDQHYMPFGGLSARGGRIASWVQVNQTAATSSANTNRNYVGVSAGAVTSVGDGGTDLTTGAKGAYFGIGPQCDLLSGATNVLECTGGEADTFVAAGASAKIVYGWSVASSNQARGSTYDAALAVGAQSGHIGYKYGLQFTDANGGAPFYSGSTLIGGYFPTLGTQAVHNLVDFSQFSCDGFAWQSPGAAFIGCNGAGLFNGLTSGGLYGGSSATSTLTLGSTSGVGTSDSITFKTGSNVTRGTIDTNGIWYFGTGSSPISGQLAQFHAATNVNMLFANGSGTFLLNAVNDANGANIPAQINASTLNLNAALKSQGVAAVSCAAGTVNLSTLVVTNGIVTHC